MSAYIIPTSDPHKSEYIPNYWKTREWLTDFSGSAGTCVVTNKHAGLWTDSRYFIQAESQLSILFKLHKLKTRGPEYQEWLIENLDFGDVVGIDGRLFSSAEIEEFEKKASEKQIRIIDAGDLFEKIWKDRPALPSGKIIEHELKFSGKTISQKIEEIRNGLIENRNTCTLITALDEIAWVLNLRGNDIEYNPVFSSFLFISLNETYLFVNENCVSDAIRQMLKSVNVSVLPYAKIDSHLTELKPYSNILADKNALNFRLSKRIPKECKIVSEPSFVAKLKVIKNSIEIENYHQAQIRDGIAMCEYLKWLEENVKNGDLTEYSVALKLEQFRSEQKNFMGLSFGSISAYQANAALPHYSVDRQTASLLKPCGMYLIDSGGQYLDGTTDITRTVALGEVTEEQKVDFTLVLKGHIRLARAKFPKGTKGFHLDTLARLDLWQHNKDYGHGTGHGIGYFLNVHEGPQGFSQATIGNASAEIIPGMLTTNEPGFYLEGKYGIRIENVLLCEFDNSINDVEYYKFRTITYCPIDKGLIVTAMLTSDERNWINNYHQMVYEYLSPIASKKLSTWLKEKTSPFK
ncbi:MAG: aminopeptidase P family protein [Salinivirgaceae bacterium]|nr:aminopeptidase P family protein [Salinivirgaceae bacterium]